MSRGSLTRTVCALVTLLSCTPTPDPWPCRALLKPGPGPSNEAELQLILQEVRETLYAADADLSVTLVPLTSQTDFFTSNLDTNTISDEPRQRAYQVKFNARLFEDPPTRAAVAAIVAHELEHVRDYAGMDTDTLAQFALVYALSDDNSVYERATDLKAMERGCGAGLIEYREWLYAKLADDPDAVALKQRDYWTPSELRAWIDANEPDKTR